MENRAEIEEPRASPPGRLAIEMLAGFGRGTTMKESTKDVIKGTAHEVKGAVKEKVGNATRDTNLQTEGRDENVTGKILKKVGRVEKAVGG
jgi:uncharacterized protein YjbJ (UPF0337 family)